MSDTQTDKLSEVMDVKEPITYDEQVKRIAAKGFIIENPDSCKEFLKQANYYRLLAYYLPFKKKDGTYFKGIPFKRIQRIYEFDSHLRSVLSRVIEQIEFYLRTQISYHLSFEYGALGYLDATTFNSHHNDEIFKEKIAACIADNKRTLVVKHHNQKYGGKFPLWVIIEFFSMGTLSYLYADLLTPDKKQIASTSFNTSADCLQSWLRCLKGNTTRYAFNAATLKQSTIAWKNSPAGLFVSTDGGKTWGYGWESDDTAVKTAILLEQTLKELDARYKKATELSEELLEELDERYQTATAVSAELQKTLDQRYEMAKKLSKELYPAAKIYICTPIQGYITTRSYAQSKAKGDYLKLLAGRMSLEVIDTFCCGICDIYEKKDANGRYLIDGLHPNAAGAKKIGVFNASAVIASYR